VGFGYIGGHERGLHGRMRDWIRYSLAVVGYIVLAMFTKHYLTWTYGPIYFIVVLEVVPRVFRRIRSWFTRRPELAVTDS
jgi:hypothetical protein